MIKEIARNWVAAQELESIDYVVSTADEIAQLPIEGIAVGSSAITPNGIYFLFDAEWKKYEGQGGGGEAVLTNLYATENGTYNHEGFDGYDVVTVNVESAGPEITITGTMFPIQGQVGAAALEYMTITTENLHEILAGLFNGCAEAETFPALNMEAYVGESGYAKYPRINPHKMFMNCEAMTELPEITVVDNSGDEQDRSFYYFGGDKYDDPEWTVPMNSSPNDGYAFYNCKNLEEIPDSWTEKMVDGSEGIMGQYALYGDTKDFGHTFEGCQKLKEIPAVLDNVLIGGRNIISVGNVDMYAARYAGCTNLESLTIPVMNCQEKTEHGWQDVPTSINFKPFHYYKYDPMIEDYGWVADDGRPFMTDLTFDMWGDGGEKYAYSAYWKDVSFSAAGLGYCYAVCYEGESEEMKSMLPSIAEVAARNGFDADKVIKVYSDHTDGWDDLKDDPESWVVYVVGDGEEPDGSAAVKYTRFGASKLKALIDSLPVISGEDASGFFIFIGPMNPETYMPDPLAWGSETDDPITQTLLNQMVATLEEKGWSHNIEA